MGRGGAHRTSLATARLYLVGVTVLWGTYTPVVRRLFMEPGAPDPTTLTLVRSVIAAAALLLASLWTPADSQPNGTDSSRGMLRSMDRFARAQALVHVHAC
jgi:drug/metabolite transporter (DMT)-like permease